jgi:hypothetical protein
MLSARINGTFVMPKSYLNKTSNTENLNNKEAIDNLKRVVQGIIICLFCTNHGNVKVMRVEILQTF